MLIVGERFDRRGLVLFVGRVLIVLTFIFYNIKNKGVKKQIKRGV